MSLEICHEILVFCLCPVEIRSLTGLRRNSVGFLRTNRHHNPQSVGDDPFRVASGKERQVVAVLGQPFSVILQTIGRPHVSLLLAINNLVEPHCYGLGRLLYILGPITSFFSIVTDEDLRGQNVLHFNLFQLLRDCSTIALPLPML